MSFSALQDVYKRQANQADACHGQQKSGKEPEAWSLSSQEHPAQDGGKERGNGDDDPHVGCQSIGKGDVFQEIVHGLSLIHIYLPGGQGKGR